MLSHFRTGFQRLFSFYEDELGPIGPRHRKLMEILDVVQVERFVPLPALTGKPPKDRRQLARAFVAKAVFRLSFNQQLRDLLLSDKQLRTICGWDTAASVPHSSKFSRVFAEFAEAGVPDKAHAALIKSTFADSVVFHTAIDSMPVETRERIPRVKKSGRNRQKPTRVERQASGILSTDDMLNELPKKASKGQKKNPRGFHFTWSGYKLHLAIEDRGLPLAYHLTSANVNDHEVALPLARRTAERCDYFYLLGDNAYDVKAVVEAVKDMGHVPVIDPKPYNADQKREKEAENKRRHILGFLPATKRRYRERSRAERPNALIADYYGAQTIYYRGYQKVSCHLGFGILALSGMTVLGFG